MDISEFPSEASPGMANFQESVAVGPDSQEASLGIPIRVDPSQQIMADPIAPAPSNLLEFLNERLRNPVLSPTYLYTSSIAILFSLFVSFLVNYKKNVDEENLIQTKLRPKLIASICQQIEKDNENMVRLLQEKKDKEDAEREQKSRLKSLESQESQETITNTLTNALSVAGEAEPETDPKSELETELETKEQQLVSLEQENNEMNPKYISLTQEYSSNSNKLTETNADLSHKKSEQEDLSKEASDFESQLINVKSENKSLTSKISDQKKIQKKHNDLKAKCDRKSKDLQKEIDMEGKKIRVLKQQVEIEDQAILQKEGLVKEKDELLLENDFKIDQARNNFNALNKAFSKLDSASAKGLASPRRGDQLTSKEKLEALTDSSKVELELEAVKEEIASLQYIYETNEEDYKIQLQAYEESVKFLNEKSEGKVVKEEALRKLKTKLKVAKDFYTERDLTFQTKLGAEMTGNSMNEQELDGLNKEELSLKKQIKELQDTTSEMKQKLQSVEREKRDKVNRLMKEAQINLMHQKEAEMKLNIKNDEIEQLKNNMMRLEEDLIRSRNLAGIGAPRIDEAMPQPPRRSDLGSPDASFDRNEPRPPTPPSAADSSLEQVLLAQMAQMQSMNMNMMNNMGSMPGMGMNSMSPSMNSMNPMMNPMMMAAYNRAPSMPNMAAFMQQSPGPMSPHMNRPSSVGINQFTGVNQTFGQNVNFQQQNAQGLVGPPAHMGQPQAPVNQAQSHPPQPQMFTPLGGAPMAAQISHPNLQNQNMAPTSGDVSGGPQVVPTNNVQVV